MSQLSVTLIQTSLYWEDPTANRAMLEEKIHQINAPTDLVVLPEMFTTGFTMNAPAVAEPMNLTTFRWMRQMAAHTQAVVTGSYVVYADGQYFNRLVWMQPDGTFDYYDKRHLFRMAQEHEHYGCGNRLIIKEIKGFRVCPLICYDLRFPVWSRNQHLAYDVLLYVANWPAARSAAWRTLLRARAIENLSYVLGVNRVGHDAHGNHYSGDSAVIDFTGHTLIETAEQEAISTQIIELEPLRSFRERFPAHLDADAFRITP